MPRCDAGSQVPVHANFLLWAEEGCPGGCALWAAGSPVAGPLVTAPGRAFLPNLPPLRIPAGLGTRLLRALPCLLSGCPLPHPVAAWFTPKN